MDSKSRRKPLPHACLLARAAERSLDVQYYIWHGDTPVI